MEGVEQCFFVRDDFPGADEVSVEKGSFLLMEGDSSDRGAYLLLEGSVEVFVADVDGSETLLFTLSPGQLIGEMGLMGVKQHMACARCMTPVRVLRISRAVWDTQMQSENFLRRVLNSTVLHFAATQKVVRRLGQSQVLHRLGIYMLGRKEWISVTGDSVEVELPTHVNMARMLNCTREHVTKLMKRCTEAGAVAATEDGRTVSLSKEKIAKLLTLNKETSR